MTIEEEIIACPDCGSNCRDYDMMNGEELCNDCGLVLDCYNIEQYDQSTLNIDNLSEAHGRGPADSRNLPMQPTTIPFQNRDHSGARLSSQQSRTFHRLRRYQTQVASNVLGSRSRRDSADIIRRFFGDRKGLCDRALTLLNHGWPNSNEDKSPHLQAIWEVAQPYGVEASAAACIKVALEEVDVQIRPSNLHELMPSKCDNPQECITDSVKALRLRDGHAAQARPTATGRVCHHIEEAIQAEPRLLQIATELEDHAVILADSGEMPPDSRNWLSNLAWRLCQDNGISILQKELMPAFNAKQTSTYSKHISAYIDGGMAALVRFKRGI
jgi:hypothetical protein